MTTDRSHTLIVMKDFHFFILTTRCGTNVPSSVEKYRVPVRDLHTSKMIQKTNAGHTTLFGKWYVLNDPGQSYGVPLPWDDTNLKTASLLHLTKAVTAVQGAFSIQFWRFHFLGVLLQQARTQSTIASGIESRTGPLALKMHQFCSNVLR